MTGNYCNFLPRIEKYEIIDMREFKEIEKKEVESQPAIGQRLRWRNKTWTIVKMGVRPNGVQHIDIVADDGDTMSAYGSLYKTMKVLEQN